MLGGSVGRPCLASAELLKVQRNATCGGLASTRQAMCAVSILATPYTLTPRGMHTGGTARTENEYFFGSKILNLKTRDEVDNESQNKAREGPLEPTADDRIIRHSTVGKLSH